MNEDRAQQIINHLEWLIEKLRSGKVRATTFNWSADEVGDDGTTIYSAMVTVKPAPTRVLYEDPSNRA